MRVVKFKMDKIKESERKMCDSELLYVVLPNQ